MPGMLAIANVGRAAAFRSGYFLRDVTPITISTAQRSGVIQDSIRIDLNTGAEPHRCSFAFKGGSGFVPHPGQTVSIGHGTAANKLFSGRIIKAERVVTRNVDRRPTYDCDAVGWLFDLDQARVFPGFSVQSLAPRSIVQRLLLSTSPNVSSLGFTSANVDPELPVLEDFSVGPMQTVSEALARIFRAVDANWYLDHDRDLHAFSAINSLPGVPTTITSDASLVWQVTTNPTDFSRVFTRVHVSGASQPSLADWDPARHATVPIDSAWPLTNAIGGFGDDFFVNSTETWTFDGVQPSFGFFFMPKSQFNAGQASVFLPAALGSNTLVIVSQNVASVSPIDANRWYNISGQMLYVASTAGVYSATVDSIAYGYYLYSAGSGAITADIQSFADIASPFNLTISSPTLHYGRVVPSGAPLRVFATRVNSAGVDYIRSLTLSADYGLISRSFDDERLSPDGAAAVCSAALQRGDPAQWASVTFTTREDAYAIGGPVFVSMTSPAEPSGYSIVGTFTVNDMTIGGFGRLTSTKGPERTITAGAVRRPTLWQVLQGE